MASQSPQFTRRTGILVNYAAIVLIGVLFYQGKYHGWSAAILIGLFASAGIVAAGFVRLHAKTHMWNFTHEKIEKLDERELQIILQSLRHSYMVFTVTCIIIVLALSLLAGRHDSMLMLICVSLVYLAHTLPSSVIAWRSRGV